MVDEVKITSKTVSTVLLKERRIYLSCIVYVMLVKVKMGLPQIWMICYLVAQDQKLVICKNKQLMSCCQNFVGETLNLNQRKWTEESQFNWLIIK